MTHTPEPWFIQGGLTEEESCRAGGIAPTIIGVIQEDGENFAIDILDEMKDEDFERIVKCVNACAGMENPAEEIQTMREELEQLRKFKADSVELKSKPKEPCLRCEGKPQPLYPEKEILCSNCWIDVHGM